MELSQNQLMEIGLNLIGFLAAGGLLILLSSIFKKNPNQVAEASVETTLPSEAQPVKREPQGKIEPDFQFISLGNSPAAAKEMTPARQSRPDRARNRAEVYQLARQMLQEKRPANEIINELPVSEAEMNLLKARANEENGENNG